MRLGRVDLLPFSDDHLESMFQQGRTWQRDLRIAGCYGLANLMKAFTTEVALELNLRDMARDRAERNQLTLADADEIA